MKLEINENEKKTLICLIENEINSNKDYIIFLKGEEKEHWDLHNKELKEILEKLKIDKEHREEILEKLDSNKVTFICNECSKEYVQEEEPHKCECGMDNFGIMD